MPEWITKAAERCKDKAWYHAGVLIPVDKFQEIIKQEWEKAQGEKSNVC